MSATVRSDAAPAYSRTQVGWWMIFALGASLLFVPLLASVNGIHPALLAADVRLFIGLVLAILLLTAALFSTLTIRIGDDRLRWRFGPGLLRFSVPLDQIAAVTPTRTSLLAGLGIHWLGSGWVYNVSGRDAIEITRHDGGKIWLGTPEPEVLAAALDRARVAVAPPRPAAR